MWNSNFKHKTGYTPEDLQGKKALSWFRPEDRARVGTAIHRVFEEGNGEVVAPILAYDGSLAWYKLNGTKMIFEKRQYLVGVGLAVEEPAG
jgi:PAS domain S-box-containing protein